MADTYTTNLNLKKPGYDSPADIKDLNDNFDKIDTSVNQLSQQIVDYRTAVNLLDNSDFRNPVNQRGQESYTEGGYTIDRWLTTSASHHVFVQSDGLRVVGMFRQYCSSIKAGQTYTIAAKNADGNLYVYSGVYGSGTIGNGSDLSLSKSSSTGYATFQIIGRDTAWEWAALYEGEYTAENLPPYVPKGYAVELAECQRYYQRVDRTIAVGASNTREMAYIFIPLPQKLREVEVTIEDLGNLWAYTPTGDAAALTYTGCMRSENGIRLHFSCQINTYYPISVPDIQFGVSADL